MIDRRFPTALQIMHSLELAERAGGELVSSAQLAKWLDANPTLVRKLLKTLAEHGLVNSQMGRNGGVRIARSASDITLKDIYRAALADKKFWTPRPNLPPICIVSTNFEAYFESVSRDMDNALLETLKCKSLSESVDQLMEIHNRECAAGNPANLAFYEKDGEGIFS